MTYGVVSDCGDAEGDSQHRGHTRFTRSRDGPGRETATLLLFFTGWESYILASSTRKHLLQKKPWAVGWSADSSTVAARRTETRPEFLERRTTSRGRDRWHPSRRGAALRRGGPGGPGGPARIGEYDLQPPRRIPPRGAHGNPRAQPSKPDRASSLDGLGSASTGLVD